MFTKINKLKSIVLFTIIFKINYLYTTAVKYEYELNSFGHQLNRTNRQTKTESCIVPVIINGNVEILSETMTDGIPVPHLLLNITCEFNYILNPPNNNLIFCIKGYWNKEIPKCIQCGQRMGNLQKTFIVNGTLSKFAEFPWHVGIYKKDPTDDYPIYECGGTIINENSILTVAHCVSDDYGDTIEFREYHIAAGKHNSNYSSEKSKHVQRKKVVKINAHPLYKGILTTYAYDIAVLIVDTPIQISPIVQPICVDWATNFENEQLTSNQYGQIAGWGSTEKNLQIASSELRILKLPYINTKQCQDFAPKTFIRYITTDKFCAGYTNGSSVCGGDSGGGLVFEKEENHESRYYIRGLVSVGVQKDGACDDTKYSTYTKVSVYLSFIQDSIQNKPITPTTPTTTTTWRPPSVQYEPTIPDIEEACVTPNGEKATCISIYLCQNILDALKNNSTPEIIDFIKKSKCGNPNEKKVCCGSTIKDNKPPEIVNTTPKFQHKNVDLLPPPGVCGRQDRLHQPKIYGGQVAQILDYPWLALLEYNTNNTQSTYNCAGFLINERYILTVAHCVESRSNIPDLRVRLGVYNISSAIDCVNLKEGTGLLPNELNCSDPHLSIGVEQIHVHPSYNLRDRIRNDIALIRLNRRVHYTPFIKPICLPLNGEKSFPGKQLTIAGWGRTETGAKSSVKLKALVPFVSDEKCANVYSRLGIKLDMSHMCVGGEAGIDACAGDDGGPVMSKLGNSRDLYAEGIISFGPRNCGRNGIPSVNTKVAYFINWILAIIEP